MCTQVNLAEKYHAGYMKAKTTSSKMKLQTLIRFLTRRTLMTASTFRISWTPFYLVLRRNELTLKISTSTIIIFLLKSLPLK